MRRLLMFMAVLCMTSAASGEDNVLTAEEQEAGWELLFDGETLEHWMTSDGKPSERPVEDSAINPHRCGGYMLVHEELREDFTIAIVTHSMQQAARVSQRTAYFHLGRLVEIGSTDQMFTTPQHRLTEDYITGRFG